jgi:hypothetical protein
MVDSTAEELARLRQRVEQLEGRRRSPATLVAMLALIAALSGGTAWAAATVGTADIKNKAVTTPKLDTEAVTTAKLAPRAVKPAKIAPGAVRTGKIFDDAVTSAKIRDGHVRAPDLGVITERFNSTTLPAGTTGGVVASCNAGERVISGGHDISTSTNVVNRTSVRSGNGWAALFRNNDASTRTIWAFAYCLAAP